jgi:hypothetical protein
MLRATATIKLLLVGPSSWIMTRRRFLTLCLRTDECSFEYASGYYCYCPFIYQPCLSHVILVQLRQKWLRKYSMLRNFRMPILQMRCPLTVFGIAASFRISRTTRALADVILVPIQAETSSFPLSLVLVGYLLPLCAFLLKVLDFLYCFKTLSFS